jgi:oligopeptide/dipeptide ABC transporter ATP-binding protein
MTPLLAVRHLHKHYPVAGKRASARDVWRRLLHRRNSRTSSYQPAWLHAVDDVNLTIAEGESLGLVGESGCGKSTLVRLLARLIDPTEGSIVFAGKEIGAISPGRFGRSPERGKIQVVFQDSHDSLNPRFTAFDCIAEPLRRLACLPSRQATRARVDELAKMVHLPAELLGRFPHQLSGGQKARVNIARAIALQPRLLILDEPTSALDVSVQARILQLLDDLRRQLGMTYLFVSHDLNVVRLLCDRVMVMYLGKVVEIGPAKGVFNGPMHPYTHALVSAIPSHRQSSRSTRIYLTGEPRSPINPDPHVCRFYGRCPRGQERCHQVMPRLETHAPERAVACHFPQSNA